MQLLQQLLRLLWQALPLLPSRAPPNTTHLALLQRLLIHLLQTKPSSRAAGRSCNNHLCHHWKHWQQLAYIIQLPELRQVHRTLLGLDSIPRVPLPGLLLTPG